jgi:hypothetical protein
MRPPMWFVAAVVLLGAIVVVALWVAGVRV